jgi:serine protease Do
MVALPSAPSAEPNSDKGGRKGMWKLTRVAEIALASLLLLLMFSNPAIAQGEGPPTAEKVAALNAPATVLLYGTYKAVLSYPYAIYDELNDGSFSFEAHPEKGVFTDDVDQAWMGSGFIITPDGYILTNAHVASNKAVKDLYLWNRAASDTVAQMNKGTISQAQAQNWFIGRYLFYVTHGKLAPEATAVYAFLGTVTFTEDLTAKGIMVDTKISGEPIGQTFESMWKDVAVTKISVDFPLPTVPLGDSNDVDTGQAVYVIGYPYMETGTAPGSIFEPTITAGIASAIKAMPGGWKAIQTDATIHHGNSGGPAFNSKGEAIGLATFGAAAGGEELSGINFLVPINVAKEFVTQIGVDPSRGEIDKLWEEGLNLYWENHYSAAIDQFKKVLEIYPGHPYATRYMRQAQKAVSEGKDVPVSPFGGTTTLMAAGIGVVAIAVVAVLVVSRRRKPKTMVSVAVPASGVTRYCQKCGTPIPSASDKFCPSCGAPAP